MKIEAQDIDHLLEAVKKFTEYNDKARVAEQEAAELREHAGKLHKAIIDLVPTRPIQRAYLDWADKNILHPSQKNKAVAVRNLIANASGGN